LRSGDTFKNGFNPPIPPSAILTCSFLGKKQGFSCFPRPPKSSLSGRFAVVVRLAQRLPVVAIPKQRHVSAVWDDMINDGRGVRIAFLFALHAYRMLRKITLARALPLTGVSALVRRGPLAWRRGCRVWDWTMDRRAHRHG
jgi:hypothetical protein